MGSGWLVMAVTTAADTAVVKARETAREKYEEL